MCLKPAGKFCTALCLIPCPLPPGSHCAVQNFVSECIPGALRNRAVLHPGDAVSAWAEIWKNFVTSHSMQNKAQHQIIQVLYPEGLGFDPAGS